MISAGCRLPQGMLKVHKNIEMGYRTGGALRTGEMQLAGSSESCKMKNDPL